MKRPSPHVNAPKENLLKAIHVAATPATSNVPELQAHEKGGHDSQRVQPVRVHAGLGELVGGPAHLRFAHAGRAANGGQAYGMARKKGACTPACQGCDGIDAQMTQARAVAGGAL